MTSIVEGNLHSYFANGALAEGDRVKFTSSAVTVEVAGATDTAVGVVDRAYADGELATVRMFVPGTTVRLRSSGSIGLGVTIGAAAAGEVSATPGTSKERYRAMQAVTAADRFLEALVLFVGVDTDT